MTAGGMVVCAILGAVAAGCLAALIALALSERNERRELYDRIFGRLPAKKDVEASSPIASAHERAIKKWRHADELPPDRLPPEFIDKKL